MLSKYVLPGTRLELSTIDKKLSTEGETVRRVYKSRVYEVLSEEQIEVTMPLERTKLILLPVDEEFEVYFYTGSGLYQCIVRIIDRYKRDNIYILVLELISNLCKYQRREYYRYSCSLEMMTRPLEEQEVAAIEENQLKLVPGLPLKRSIIADISGGGLRFIASQQYEIGSLLYCKWVLLIEGESKEYDLVGRVLFCEEIESKKGEYEHRVQYVNLDEDEREEIIRYIFEEERKNRRRKIGK